MATASRRPIIRPMEWIQSGVPTCDCRETVRRFVRCGPSSIRAAIDDGGVILMTNAILPFHFPIVQFRSDVVWETNSMLRNYLSTV